MREDQPKYPQKKLDYIGKVHSLLDQYQKIIFVKMQYVSSNHIKTIRNVTRGKAEMVMGKNTLIKKAISTYPRRTEKKLDVCFNHLEGCIAMVMTNGDVKELKASIEEFSCAPSVKAGAIAISDVEIAPHVTSLSPDKTDFFQNLNIATRIEKTSIQILNPVKLVKKGDKINSSQAALMDLLKMRPFVYRANCTSVWDSGSVYDIDLLNIESESLVEATRQGIQNVLYTSFSIGIPSALTAGHSIRTGLHRAMLISMGGELDNSLTKSLEAAAAETARLLAAGVTIPSTAAVSQESEKTSGTKAASKEPVAVATKAKVESESSEDLGDAFADMF